MRINIHNHLAPHVPTFILLIISVIILYFLNFDKYVVQVFLMVWVLDLVPSFYLHIEYWLKNKGEEYEIHFDELIRYKNGERETYKISDIEGIKVYLSPALYRGSNLHFLGIEAYHYARIYLKSGEELILTCLLTPKVEKSLKGLSGVKIERKKRLFNTLEWK